MIEIQQTLAGIKLGAPQAWRNLALFPLIAPADTPAGYLLLDEALERKLARVTEVSREGRVPELAWWAAVPVGGSITVAWPFPEGSGKRRRTGR